MKTKPWELWNGKVVQSPDNGELYIQTPDAEWQYRLRIWKEAIAEASKRGSMKTECPSPMPFGHIMFEKDSRFREVSDRGAQRELFGENH